MTFAQGKVCVNDKVSPWHKGTDKKNKICSAWLLIGPGKQRKEESQFHHGKLCDTSPTKSKLDLLYNPAISPLAIHAR
jgi:hypothetical protein